jgi:hypothetical protein
VSKLHHQRIHEARRAAIDYGREIVAADRAAPEK